jgi:hypothetical protein
MHRQQILLQRAHLVHVSEGEEMLYEQFIARDVADRHGGRVAADREILAELCGERRRRESSHRAFSKKVVVGTHTEMPGDWPIGNDKIQPVNGQIRHQAIEPAFPAHQPDGFPQLQGWLYQTAGDELRD